ncbi:hypothetical protein C8R42DRAFT_772420 [Lentinula raphanica]|nr:hypothetical protein C8R42DRAFT_772420 [Lentinula raphanica]
MASTETQLSPESSMKHSLTMDRFSGSGRTDSTVDDSPFGSALNTPSDEDVQEPFGLIGGKLIELQEQRQTQRVVEHQDYDSLKEPHQFASETPRKQVMAEDLKLQSSIPEEVDNTQSRTQSENDQDSMCDTTSPSISSDITFQAEAEGDDGRLTHLSDISVDSDRLFSPFPPVPFSSPEVSNVQIKPASSVTFSNELSRSLCDIQNSQSTQSFLEQSPSIQSLMSHTDSPVLLTPELVQGFHVHSRASSLYTLPNAPIAISPSLANAEHDTSDHDVVEMDSASRAQVSPYPDQEDVLVHEDLQHDDFDPEPEYTFSVLRSLDFSPANLPVLFFKLACFVPWCALVGGTILLSPTNIEKVAFSPGIGIGNLRMDYVSPPPKNIHRFAHWAECAIPQMMIFLATCAVGLWFLSASGLGLAFTITTAAVLVAQTVFAWQDFDFKSNKSGTTTNKSFGEDDRESVWMVIRMYVLGEESKTWLTGSLEQGIFVDQKAD